MKYHNVAFIDRVSYALREAREPEVSLQMALQKYELELAPNVLRAAWAQRRDDRISMHHDNARGLALVDVPGDFWAFSTMFVRLIEYSDSGRVAELYREMAHRMMDDDRRSIQRETMLSAAQVIAMLRRIGWLEDDDTPDPDAMEQRCDAVTRAYLDARYAEINAFRSPDPDPLDAFLDWADQQPEASDARPEDVRKVVIHAEPDSMQKTGAGDEMARHSFRQSLATPKDIGPRLTRHQVDEIYAQLFAESPWHANAITWFWQRHLAALEHPEGSLRLPPVLIVGPPGSGKTHLIARLAELLATPSVRMDMSGSLEPWPIAGGAWGWRNAQPGIAVKAIQESGCANPMIMLDEIEKAGRGSHGNPLNALLPLLQSETAQKYRCPYLEAEVDLSRVSWILLGNSLDRIPAPLLDRVQILRARGPEGPEVRQLAERLLGETAADSQVIDAVVSAFGSGKMSLRGLHRLAAKFREIDTRPQFN